MIDTDVFIAWLGRTTWQVSLLIVLVLFVQRLLRTHLTPRWRYFLWFLVLARMALPALPESPFSLFNVIPNPQRWTQIARTVPGADEAWTYRPNAALEIGETTAHLDEPEENVAVALTSPPVTQTTARSVSSPPRLEEERAGRGAFAILWGVGALLFLAYIVGQSVATRVWYGRNRTVEDGELMEILEECKREMGLRQTIRLLESPAQSSPALMGVWNPTLLVPAGVAGVIGKENLRFVFLHELAHVKRRDIWVNWLATFLLAMHWFNPLAWYALRRMRSDQELACDDYALRFTRPGEAKRYGETVVRLLEGVVVQQRLPGMAGILEDKSLMKRRIQMIVDFKKPGPAWTAVTVAVVSAITLVSFTDAIGEEEATSSDERDASIVVKFPADKKVGDIITLDDTIEEEEWILLAQAQGEVSVPRGVPLKLVLTREGARDLSWLNKIPSDLLYAVRCHQIPISDPSPIARLTSLQELYLWEANLDDRIFDVVQALPNLRILTLGKDSATSEGLKTLKDIPSLTSLDLFRHSGLNDEALREIAKNPHIQMLNLKRTNVSDAGLLHLETMSNLKDLNLARTEVTDVGLESVGRIPQLEHLDLGRSKVSSEGIERLTGLKELRSLKLGDTLIDDSAGRYLGELSNLEYLDVENTSISEASIPSLERLTQLREFPHEGSQIDESALLASPILGKFSAVQNPEAPKVGIVFSHFAATGPSRTGQTYNYGRARTIASRLYKNGFDLFAIVEPGTEEEPLLLEAIAKLPLQNKMILANDVDRLRDLDVIVCRAVANYEVEYIGAVRDVVSEGVGYVQISSAFGVTPGYSQTVQDLLGIRDAKYVWKGWGERTSVVCSSHPILGVLQPGDDFWIDTPNGYAGVHDGQSLLLAPSEFEADYSPLYVRQLGEGRIVCIQWHRTARATPPFNEDDIYVRSVNWAAKRPVGAKWTIDSGEPQG